LKTSKGITLSPGSSGIGSNSPLRRLNICIPVHGFQGAVCTLCPLEVIDGVAIKISIISCSSSSNMWSHVKNSHHPELLATVQEVGVVLSQDKASAASQPDKQDHLSCSPFQSALVALLAHPSSSFGFVGVSLISCACAWSLTFTKHQSAEFQNTLAAAGSKDKVPSRPTLRKMVMDEFHREFKSSLAELRSLEGFSISRDCVKQPNAVSAAGVRVRGITDSWEIVDSLVAYEEISGGTSPALMTSTLEAVKTCGLDIERLDGICADNVNSEQLAALLVACVQFGFDLEPYVSVLRSVFFWFFFLTLITLSSTPIRR
jgi:hypothetical protein